MTAKQTRIVNTICNPPEKQPISYNHSTLCQTSLPFKNIEDSRKYQNVNGDALVLISAGDVYNPELKKFIEMGLPYGAKARLILMYLSSQAVKTQSPIIDVERSFYAFLKRLGLAPTGTEYKRVKDQLARLSAASITIGRTELDGSGSTQWGRFVSKLNVFFPKDDAQKLMWPTEVQLDYEFFSSLVQHAVPLDEVALGALRDSALELDLYTMLSERLHRIPKNKPQFVPWAYLYEQYGNGYSRLRDFRRDFLVHLSNVQAVYQKAKLEEVSDNSGQSKGILLLNSPSPVSKKSVAVLGSDDGCG